MSAGLSLRPARVSVTSEIWGLSMEIRDPLHGSMYFSENEVAILDTSEFQRLRAIKQLGFSEFSFPGATHNRYIHSLGVAHVAGQIFDSIFKAFPFKNNATKMRMRQVVRLASLLHDSGHGPLSHTTELVMPPVEDLKVGLYNRIPEPLRTDCYSGRRATHEDYTIKYLTDSGISECLKVHFPEIAPENVAALIDNRIPLLDDFFVDSGICFRPLLSQIVSSELDSDRLDYLERDSYFCGTDYGRIDSEWLIQNMTFQVDNGQMYLAINKRALYSFDDFLISRHHMHLMVYFHHKSIVYEEMLNRYLSGPDCTFRLPGDIAEYTKYNDYKLHEHLATSTNDWARRIAQRRPYRVLLELHNTAENPRVEQAKKWLESKGLSVIWASSRARLSKYHSAPPNALVFPIYVKDQYDIWEQPTPIDQSTEIFKKYERARIIDRLYVKPEEFLLGQTLVNEQLGSTHA